MNFEIQNNTPQWKESSFVKELDTRRQHATEIQRGPMEIQMAKYGNALHTLMERTGDDSRVTNGLNTLLDTLNRKAKFGTSDQPLHEVQIVKILNFLAETNKTLDGLIGGKPQA